MQASKRLIADIPYHARQVNGCLSCGAEYLRTCRAWGSSRRWGWRRAGLSQMWYPISATNHCVLDALASSVWAMMPPLPRGG